MAEVDLRDALLVELRAQVSGRDARIAESMAKVEALTARVAELEVGGAPAPKFEFVDRLGALASLLVGRCRLSMRLVKDTLSDMLGVRLRVTGGAGTNGTMRA